MGARYVYNKKSKQPKVRHIFMPLVITFIVVGIGYGIIYWFQTQIPRSNTVQGKAISVPQSVTGAPNTKVTEPTFTMELPPHWKLISQSDTSAQHSYSWSSTIKSESNRTLTVYVDTIPATMPVNSELPLTPNGNALSFGQLSDNCSNFTPGGTQNVAQAERLKPTQTVWQNVDFICNLPRVVDNQIGTGSVGHINSVSVTGPKEGTHQYFFLFTDHNIQPDPTILLNAIESFRAR